MKYKYKVIVRIKDKVYKCFGYYDSGNTLVHNLCPVIFMNGINGEKKIEFSCANGEGKSSFIKGEILVNRKSYVVYIASSFKSFNGCQVLLNALLV